MASGVNFTKEVPLKEISENSKNLNILPKKIRGRGGVDFTKEITLNEISANLKNMLKKVRGVIFSKELPFTLKVQHF